MKNNKGFAPLITILIVALVAIVAGGAGFYLAKKGEAPAPQEQIVGNDKDEHGCIGSAGYSWCEIKQKCLRSWEEKCEIEKSTTTQNITPFRIEGWRLYTDIQSYFELQYPPSSSYIEVKPDRKISIKRIEFSNLSMGPTCRGLKTSLEVIPDATKNLPKLIPNSLIPVTKSGLKVYNNPFYTDGIYTPTYTVLLPNDVALIYSINGDCPPSENEDAINLMHTISSINGSPYRIR